MTHRRFFLQNVSSWNFIVQPDRLPEVLVMAWSTRYSKIVMDVSEAMSKETTLLRYVIRRESTTSWIALRTSNMYLWKISKRKKRALHKVYICFASMNIISSSRNWIFIKIKTNGHQEMKVGQTRRRQNLDQKFSFRTAEDIEKQVERRRRSKEETIGKETEDMFN